MATPQDMFEVIDRLTTLSLVDVSSVEQFFGLKLQETQDLGNRFLRILSADVPYPGLFKHIELRLPTERGSFRGLLILKTGQKCRIPMSELREKYGAPSNVEVPRPSAPAGTPTYENYDREWGRLSLGYVAGTGNAMTDLIIERRR